MKRRLLGVKDALDLVIEEEARSFRLTEVKGEWFSAIVYRPSTMWGGETARMVAGRRLCVTRWSPIGFFPQDVRPLKQLVGWVCDGMHKRYAPTGSYDLTADELYRNRFQPELIQVWVELGMRNTWISQAVDPPFVPEQIHVCDDLDELIGLLHHSNWTVGSGFAWSDLCFINQVNGGGEYRVMKRGDAFESLTANAMTEPQLRDWVLGVHGSEGYQCRTWNYFKSVAEALGREYGAPWVVRRV